MLAYIGVLTATLIGVSYAKLAERRELRSAAEASDGRHPRLLDGAAVVGRYFLRTWYWPRVRAAECAQSISIWANRGNLDRGAENNACFSTGDDRPLINSPFQLCCAAENVSTLANQICKSTTMTCLKKGTC